ncbi:hypothetical protein WN943_008218 [Citrus x changshan-huyou]
MAGSPKMVLKKDPPAAANCEVPSSCCSLQQTINPLYLLQTEIERSIVGHVNPLKRITTVVLFLWLIIGSISPQSTDTVRANSTLSDLRSINFVTTRRSPRQASSPEVPAYTDKSEYAGCFPGANPPTLKSDMKASSESQSSALFQTVWDFNCCVMGKTWDLACYATVQGKAWLPRLCETLRVTPRFWGKCGCHGSVRSCVLRRGSGESVAVVPRFSCWRARLANCRRPGLLASRSLAGMASCLL